MRLPSVLPSSTISDGGRRRNGRDASLRTLRVHGHLIGCERGKHKCARRPIDTAGGPAEPDGMVSLPPSRWADLDGPVHYVDFGGPDDGALVVCVHGLGGSHANWLAIAP